MAVDRCFMTEQTRKALVAESQRRIAARRADRVAADLRRIVFKTPVAPLVRAVGRCTCDENRRECDCGMPARSANRTMADVLDLAEERARRRVYTGARLTEPCALL